MIASEFLDYRDRLVEALNSLADVARRSGVHAGRPALLRNLAAGLREPFMIVVAGEVGAGKSTFLNALAGEECCDPGHGAVAHYKFGEPSRDVPCGDGLVEMYRPCEFFHDFQLVEVPGSEATADGAAAVAERLVPIADLLVVVISVADAWTPGVWRALDRIHLGLEKHVLLVLTGCDSRSHEEVRAIVEHMDLTMARRYGEPLPVFRMSAETALLARSNPAGGGDAKLADSGILEFEDFVSKQVLASPLRVGRFENALRVARAILDELQAPVAETEAILGRDGDLLEGLKGTINSRYEETNRKIRDQFFGTLDEAHAAAVEVAQLELAAAAGWGLAPALLVGAAQVGPDGLAKDFATRVVEATESRVIAAISTAESDVGELWETLAARVGEEFEHQLSAGDGSGKAVWSGRGENLLRRAEACAQKACANFNIAEAAHGQWRQIARALRLCAIGAVVLSLTSAGLLAAGLSPFDLIVASLAIVALGFGAGQFIDGRRKVRRAVAECASAGRIQLRADLSRELTSHIHEYYTKLGALFDPVQALCKQQLDEVVPQITAVRELDSTVAQLAAELTPMREAASEYLRRRREVK